MATQGPGLAIGSVAGEDVGGYDGKRSSGSCSDGVVGELVEGVRECLECFGVVED